MHLHFRKRIQLLPVRACGCGCDTLVLEFSIGKTIIAVEKSVESLTKIVIEREKAIWLIEAQHIVTIRCLSIARICLVNENLVLMSMYLLF